MIFMNLLSWCCVFLVLFIYFTGTEYRFAWANMWLCIPIALPALIHGAYPSAFISLTFGVIGAHKVLSR